MSSPGSKRSPAASTWCTPTVRATPSTPVPIGTPTSRTVRSTLRSSSRSSGKQEYRSYAKHRTVRPARAPTSPICVSISANPHAPADDASGRDDLRVVEAGFAIVPIEDVRCPIKNATRWVVTAIRPHDVALRAHDVDDHESAERQHRDVPDTDRNGVRLKRKAFACAAARCVEQVHPDGNEIDDLGRLPDDERPPPRPCQYR